MGGPEAADSKQAHQDMGESAPTRAAGTSPCYKVERNATHGRHAIATRFIPAGSVIIEEQPLVIAPSECSKADFATCLGCCAVVPVSRRVLCPGCGGPLCGAACQDSPYHRGECSEMKRCNFRFKNGHVSPNHFKLLGFLRVLLQKGETAERIRKLESHSEKMLADPRVRMQMSLLVEELMPPLLSFPLEERCWAFGVMETNSFSYSEPIEGREALVLMDEVSMLSHSCVCNAYGTCYWRPEGVAGPAALDAVRKVVLAATDIEAGSLITVNYEHPHLPTAKRRAGLREGKNFTCRCRRCEDPTELGLHVSALCCVPCKNAGRLELPRPRRVEDDVASWRCPKCRAAMTTSAMDLELQLYDLECGLVAAQRRGDVAAVEAFLAKELYPRGRLHPTHELTLDAKYALTTQMYGRLPGLNLEDCTSAQLTALCSHCRDYLRAAATTEPGYGLRMGRVNLTLNRALLEIIKRTAKLPPAELTLARMAEAEACLAKVEVALGRSADLRSTLQEQRRQTDSARGVLAFLGILDLVSPSAATGQSPSS